MNKINPQKISQKIITGTKYFQNLNQFLEVVLTHIMECEKAHLCGQFSIRKQREKVIIELLEKFFFHNPVLRQYLTWLYTHFMTKMGNLTLAKEVARIYLEASEQISNNGSKVLDLPPCFDDTALLGRIGEITTQAINVDVMQQLGRIREKPILCMNNNEKVGNLALIPYLAECFEIYSDAKAYKAFELAVQFKPLTTYFYKFSDTQYGHNGQFLSDCLPNLIKAGVNIAPFKLKDVTSERAEKFLSKFGLKPNDDFVLLHLREKGHYDGNQHEFRNANVQRYILAIEYLLDMGLKVVRIGNAKMNEMFERPGFIDLTKVDRPGEVDIFLSATAKFYFGSGSGPLSLAEAFGTPCCLTDHTYEGINPNNFCQFLKFKKIDSKETLKIKEIRDLGLFGISAAIPYKKLNLIPQYSTSTDNLQLVTEMIEYLDKGPIYHKNHFFRIQKDQLNIRGGLSSNSLLMMQ